jgi:phosphopantothenoylcysteine decarboxylase / phosphopantothenate---cysteine ligase
LDKGFNVTLVYGHSSLNIPHDPSMNVIRIKTTEEMYNVVREIILEGKQCVIFHAAAVADFSVAHLNKKRAYKMDTRNGTKNIKLVPTEKIVDKIKEFDKKVFLVAFKAEYGISDKLLIKKAFDKLKECNGDLIVANDVSRNGCDFGSDTNEVYIIDKDKNVVHLPLKPKREIAGNLINLVCKKLNID